jgi:hypothetical protein
MILDADGLSKLARRDRVVREMIRQEVELAGSRLVVPMVVVTRALAAPSSAEEIRAILRGANEAPAGSIDTSILAAKLIVATQKLDVVDATVAAEALRRVPAIVITSDPDDLRALLGADERGARVEVWTV